MAGFPYIQATTRLPTFLDKVKSFNQPTKMTQQWLVDIGLTSSNDRPLIGLMKELGYTDANGVPTGKWGELRGSDAARKASIGRQLREAYPDIFSQYPDEYIASSLTKDELRNFIRPKVSTGTLEPILSTFFALRSLASFDSTGSGAVPASAGVAAGAAAPSTPSRATSATGSVNVAINLSLELPATTDADVYDKLFEAMARHLGNLLSRGS
jgi:hypothetical protein